LAPTSWSRGQTTLYVLSRTERNAGIVRPCHARSAQGNCDDISAGLLDRGYGKPTQYQAADTEAVPNDMSAEELRAHIFADF